ncbi:unnamed protein product [Umbelopsis vinacea]
MVSSVLLLPISYEWGFPNEMNEGNRTVVDILSSWFEQTHSGCKGKWVKMTDNADDTEWEKDFSTVPETDGEIPVLLVPKSSNENQQRTEDLQNSDVDNIADLFKKLYEDSTKIARE